MTNAINIVQMLCFLFRPHKKLLSVYFIGLIILSVLDVFRISLIYPIINYGLDVSTGSTFADTLYQVILPVNLNPFVASALLLAVVTIVIAGAEVVVAYLGSRTFAAVRDTTDRSVFEIIKTRPYEYFARHKQGDLHYIGESAVYKTGQAVNSTVLCLQNVLMCIFYLSFIFLISFKLSIVVLIFGIIYVLFVKKTVFSRIYKHASVLNSAALAKSVIYNEFISGIKTILITDSVDFWAGKYDDAVKKLLKSYTKVQVFQRLPGVTNNLLIFLIISLAAIGLYYITDGDFLPYLGVFGTFLFALYRMFPALNGFQSQFAAVIQQLPAIEAVYTVLQEDTGENFRQNKVPKKSFLFQRMINFRNVFFRYNGSQKDTIMNLSFEIRKNTKVAIIGNSGAGKTTIANLLALLYQPTSGELLVDGVNFNEFNHSEYLKILGYLGQETFVYHDTIKENIRFGLDCADVEIIEAAKLADAHEFIMETSDGYETIIGDQGIKLSGGQRQRIALARIMLRKPEILLLDEATSSLDNISEKNVMDAIDRISKDMTVIIIAHRLSTVKNADIMYVMKNGSICESGTHEELLELKAEYYNLYANQKTSSQTLSDHADEIISAQ